MKPKMFFPPGHVPTAEEISDAIDVLSGKMDNPEACNFRDVLVVQVELLSWIVCVMKEDPKRLCAAAVAVQSVLLAVTSGMPTLNRFLSVLSEFVRTEAMIENKESN